MQTNELDMVFSQEVGPVSPNRRGNRIVLVSSPARDLLGLLGLSLLLLGGLTT